jgi:PAS domain S-box-containing protein
VESAPGHDLALVLSGRSVRVAWRWQQALAETGFAAVSVPELRGRLRDLFERSVRALIAEPVDRAEGRAVGAAVAALHFVHPDALERTHELLAVELLRELLPAEQRYLQPRLCAFLAALGAGFTAEVRTILLAQQDTLRHAVVTERDQAYAELRAVIDAAVDAMVLISPERRTLMVNHRFTQVFGIAPEQMIGKGFEEVRPIVEPLYANPEVLGRLIMRVASSAEDATADLFQIKPQLRVLQLHSVPVQRPDGDLLGRLHIFRDVTREREVDRREREFLAGVSHELRTPLTSIKGYAELLLDEDLGGAERLEFLEIIQSNADRMKSMVNDLIDLSGLELGQLALRPGWVDIALLMERVVAALRRQIADKRQRLVVDVPASLPALWADGDRLNQVFTNLVANANHYTPEGGSITLRATADDRVMRIAVADTGVGMSAEEQVHLFTKFYRIRNRRTEGIHGTGLGLAICRSLVDLHEGTIRVQSTPGAGSTFTVELPLRAGEEA